MSFLDAIIVVCIVYNGFMGLKRGFVRLILDVSGLLISTIFGLLYYDQFAKHITNYLPALSKYSGVLSFAVIWLSLFLLVSALSIFLDKIISRTLILGPIDRLLGLGVGVVKGFLFLLPILLPLYLLQISSLKNSIFSKPITPILEKITPRFTPKSTSEKATFRLP